jgi:hypothetical protein
MDMAFFADMHETITELLDPESESVGGFLLHSRTHSLAPDRGTFATRWTRVFIALPKLI